MVESHRFGYNRQLVEHVVDGTEMHWSFSTSHGAIWRVILDDNDYRWNGWGYKVATYDRSKSLAVHEFMQYHNCKWLREDIF